MTPERPRVFVTRRLPREILDRLDVHFEVDLWDSDLPPDADSLRERAVQADGLFSLLTDRIDAVLLATAPSLKVVSNMAVGTDNIDLAAATARGIPVGNTPGVLTEDTHRPGPGAQESKQMFDEGCLARTVDTDESIDSTFLCLVINMIEREIVAERAR